MACIRAPVCGPVVLALIARRSGLLYTDRPPPTTHNPFHNQPDTSMGHPVGVETGAVKIYFRSAGVVMAMAERETFQTSKPLTGKKLSKMLPPEVSETVLQ